MADNTAPVPQGPIMRFPGLSTSTSVAKIAAALVKAQQQFKAVPLNKTAEVVSKKTGARFTYKYADLAAVLEATVPALNANGILFTQHVVSRGGETVLETTLLHESGEYLSSMVVLPEVGEAAQMTSVQAFGATITYMRRYTAVAILGIAAEEDTDAGELPEVTTKKSDNGNNGQKRDIGAEDEAIRRNLKVQIQQTLDKAVKDGKITQQQKAVTMSQIPLQRTSVDLKRLLEEVRTIGNGHEEGAPDNQEGENYQLDPQDPDNEEVLF